MASATKCMRKTKDADKLYCLPNKEFNYRCVSTKVTV